MAGVVLYGDIKKCIDEKSFIPEIWILSANVMFAEENPVTGERRQKPQTIRGTKRAAERTMREVLISLEQGLYVRPNKITLGGLLRQWVKAMFL